MVGINKYRELDFDMSIVLNFPKGLPKVVSEITAILNSRGAIVVDSGDMTVEEARVLVSKANGDTSTYYMLTSTSPKVWSILREPVNLDQLRVLGIFHGKIPSEVPENVLTIDIGRSLNRKVSKEIVSSITQAVTSSRGEYPRGKPEEVYIGIRSLCYEVLYRPEYQVFSSKVIDKIPIGYAFDFMYNPPATLDDLSMCSAYTQFMDKVHGRVG
jgi:hypothetical protein